MAGIPAAAAAAATRWLRRLDRSTLPVVAEPDPGATLLCRRTAHQSPPSVGIDDGRTALPRGAPGDGPALVERARCRPSGPLAAAAGVSAARRRRPDRPGVGRPHRAGTSQAGPLGGRSVNWTGAAIL